MCKFCGRAKVSVDGSPSELLTNEPFSWLSTCLGWHLGQVRDWRGETELGEPEPRLYPGPHRADEEGSWPISHS